MATILNPLVALLFAACALALAEVAAAVDKTAADSEGVLLVGHSAHGVVPVRSWKTLRDERIVKQDLDYLTTACLSI